MVQYHDVVARFAELIPRAPHSHMWWTHAERARRGDFTAFVQGLARALVNIETAKAGEADERLKRMAKLAGVEGGIRGRAYEGLVQQCAEVYIVSGMIELATRKSDGRPNVVLEPRTNRGKNPELIADISGLSVAVEVKAPELTTLREQLKPFQVMNRTVGKMEAFSPGVSLPRDNQVHSYLTSAQEKFEVDPARSADYRLLFIVWDDFVQEPVSILCNTGAGLLTANSYLRDAHSQPITFSAIDGVVLTRYQHALKCSMGDGPLPDQEPFAFEYRNPGLPPKAFVQNPAGRTVPPALQAELYLTPIDGLQFVAEYIPSDFIHWSR